MNLVNVEYRVIFAELERIKIKGYPFADDDMRVVMSERTLSILVENQKSLIKNDFDIAQPRIAGMKIVIDNSIPYGEARLFVDTLAL